MLVAGIGLLCALDVGWVAFQSAPNPPSAPVITTVAPPVRGETPVVEGTATAKTSATNAEEIDPAATMMPADPPPAAAPLPASQPLTPSAKHADAKRKRTTPSASVF
jgi:hypothetical protein